MTYDNLLIDYEHEVDIYEHPLLENPIVRKKQGRGFYCNTGERGIIFIERSLSDREKKCTLAEEIGHHYTSYGNILDLSDYQNAKQERHAREWAAHKLVQYGQFLKAINIYDNIYQVADELDVEHEIIITFCDILRKSVSY